MNPQIEMLKEPPSDAQMAEFCDPVLKLLTALLEQTKTGMDVLVISTAFQSATQQAMAEALSRLYPNDIFTQHARACEIAKNWAETFHERLHDSIHNLAEEVRKAPCPSQPS